MRNRVPPGNREHHACTVGYIKCQHERLLRSSPTALVKVAKFDWHRMREPKRFHYQYVRTPLKTRSYNKDNKRNFHRVTIG